MFPLAESRAIARYIATKWASQGTDLFGKTEKQRALADTWLEVEGQNYNPPVAIIVAHLVFAPMFGGTTDMKVVDEQVEKLEKVRCLFDGALGSNLLLLA